MPLPTTTRHLLFMPKHNKKKMPKSDFHVLLCSFIVHIHIRQMFPRQSIVCCRVFPGNDIRLQSCFFLSSGAWPLLMLNRLLCRIGLFLVWGILRFLPNWFVRVPMFFFFIAFFFWIRSASEVFTRVFCVCSWVLIYEVFFRSLIKDFYLCLFLICIK